MNTIDMAINSARHLTEWENLSPSTKFMIRSIRRKLTDLETRMFAERATLLIHEDDVVMLASDLHGRPLGDEGLHLFGLPVLRPTWVEPGDPKVVEGIDVVARLNERGPPISIDSSFLLGAIEDTIGRAYRAAHTVMIEGDPLLCITPNDWRIVRNRFEVGYDRNIREGNSDYMIHGCHTILTGSVLPGLPRAYVMI